MSSNEERRSAPRSPIEDTLFIESVSSNQISMVEPTTANAINAIPGNSTDIPPLGSRYTTTAISAPPALAPRLCTIPRRR